MKKEPDKRYLDLLKTTLAYTLWPEPPIAAKVFNFKRSSLKQFLFTIVDNFFRTRGLFLAQDRNIPLERRLEGRNFLPGYGETMIGLKRLNNLQACVESVLQENIAGDLIETGVWRGGACIFMRAVLAAYSVENRRVFVADSFAGLPVPNTEKYPADSGSTFHEYAFLAVSQAEVMQNFAKYDLLDEQVVFLPGWFEDTLPEAPIEELAVLRLDGDMYGSTMTALMNLYPKLSSGGYCIIDDYALPSCKQAVDDYRQQQGIAEPLMKIDWTGQYWRKN